MKFHKYKILFIPLIIIFFLVCCQEKPHSHAIFEEVESLMEINADSAYRLLKKADSTVHFNRAQRAEWNLLVTQAMDKAYMKHESDSLIREAAEYFDRTKDVTKQIRAYCYWGRIWQDLGDSPRAQQYYLKALDIGKNSEEYLLLGLINNNLGYLYLMQGEPNLAIQQLQNAIFFYEQIEENKMIVNTLKNIGRAYSSAKQIDSSLIVYKKALPLAEIKDQTAILNEIGNLYITKKDYPTAYDYINNAIINAPTNSDKTHLYFTAGRLYYEWDKPDSAVFYLNKSIESERLRTKSASYYYLYHIAQKEKRWEDFATLQKDYEILRDSITAQINTESVQKIQSLYNYQQAVSERNLSQLELAKRERNIYAVLLLCALLSLAVIFTIFKLRNEKWKKEAIKKLFQDLSDRQEATSKAQLKSNKKRIDEIIKLLNIPTSIKHKEVLLVEKDYLEKENKKLIEEIHEKNELIRKNEVKKLYLELHEELVNHINSAFRKRLMITVHTDCPDFEERIKFKYPEIETIDLDICYLTKAGFSPGRISELVRIKPSNLSMRKKRLYEKICNEKCTGKDFEILIHSL